MRNLRLIPVWGWALIVIIAVVMATALMFTVTSNEPSGIDFDGIEVCDANGENCEPLG